MPNDRRKNIIILCVLCVCGLLLLFLGGALKILACPFKKITGIPCPGCGGVRSAVALFHGDIAGAFQYNFLAPFAVLFLAASCIWLLYDISKDKNTFREFLSIKWSRAITIPTIILVTANWIYNITSGI